MHLTVNLTSLAAILWSGMLIIAGSIWVLSSQVRRLSDLMEQQARAEVPVENSTRRASARPLSPIARKVSPRVVERSTSRVN